MLRSFLGLCMNNFTLIRAGGANPRRLNIKTFISLSILMVKLKQSSFDTHKAHSAYILLYKQRGVFGICLTKVGGIITQFAQYHACSLQFLFNDFGIFKDSDSERISRIHRSFLSTSDAKKIIFFILRELKECSHVFSSLINC